MMCGPIVDADAVLEMLQRVVQLTSRHQDGAEAPLGLEQVTGLLGFSTGEVQHCFTRVLCAAILAAGDITSGETRQTLKQLDLVAEGFGERPCVKIDLFDLSGGVSVGRSHGTAERNKHVELDCDSVPALVQ